MIWLDTIIQGVLLGGLYALFAAGLSLVFGIMRLVNLAHGDLIVCAAYLLLLLVSLLGLSPWLAVLVAAPIMFGVGWLLQSQLFNRVLGADILPPLLVSFGLSIVLQNALLEGWSADSRRLPAGAWETTSISLGTINVGLMPLLTFVSAVLVIVGLNQIFYRTALGRAFRATSDDAATASLMGIRPQRIFATATGHRHGGGVNRSFIPGHARQLRPQHRPGAADLCFRGGDHRRARLALGHLARRRHHRRGANPRRRHQPGMANTRRAHRLFGSAGVAPARPAAARGRLSMAYRVSSSSRASRIAAYAALALVLIAVLLPSFASRGLIQDLFFIFTMLVLAQWWNLLAGYGGLVSVGQQAFVGMGAYALFGAVILLGWDPVPSILLGGLAALALAVPTAFFAFRLRGAYFAIGTWVIAEVVRLLVAQWRAVGGGTGTSLPRSATKDMWAVDWIKALFDVKTSAARDILAYWLALLLVLATIGAIYWLLRRRSGLALAAVRDNVDAARSVGVNSAQIKWLVFLSSAFGTGLAGALIYMQKARISPDASFSVLDWSAYVIFIVVIGGIGTIEGPILGVIVFFMLQSLLADYGSWYLMLLGLLGILVMLGARRGLWGLFSDRTGIELFPVRRSLIINNKE